VKAEDRDVPLVAHLHAPVFRAQRAGRILNHVDPVPFPDLQKPVPVQGVSETGDRDHGTRAGADRRFQFVVVDEHGIARHIHNHDPRAHDCRYIRRGRIGIIGNDDLVARPHPQAPKRHFQPHGAGGDRQGTAAPYITPYRRLEFLRNRPFGQIPAVQDLPQLFLDPFRQKRLYQGDSSDFSFFIHWLSP